MNCCVVVKVSARSVAFWYQTEGKRYSPLVMKGVHEVPLYFYVGNNQFEFGAVARDRFYQHDPDAFGDYFGIIKDPSRHFVLHNSPKRVKQLLYYGIEQFLSHFLNTVLYKSDSIESYRGAFPLRFIFEPDLGEPECRLVAGLFTEAGYRTVSVLSYNVLLLEHLRGTGLVRPGHAALMMTGLDDTLYLEFYAAGATVAMSGNAIPGQGADPRIRILSEMVIDYIRQQNPYLDLDADREVSALLPFCAGLLTGKGMIISGDAELTSGDKCWFSVKLKSIEDRLLYYSGDLVVSTSVNDLLQAAGTGPEEVVLLLCSEQIRTAYFSERLLKQYPHVKSITPAETEEAMQLVFSYTAPAAVSEPVVAGAARPPLPPARPVMRPERGFTPATAPSAKPPLPAATPSPAAPAQKPPLPAVKPVAAERPKTVVPPLPPIKKKS